MTDRENVIKKIKALRAKADDAAATQAEAIEAAALAAKLLSKHEISAEELRQNQNSEGAMSGYSEGKKLHPILAVIWASIEKLTETKAFADGAELRFVGVDSDVQMAVYLSEMITAAGKRAWLSYAEENPEAAAGGMKKFRAARESYCRFFAGAVGAKLHEMAKERQEARPPSNSTDLVVVKSEIIKQTLKERGIVLSKGRKRKQTPLDNDAAAAGTRDGQQLKINTPFGGQKEFGSLTA